MANTFTFSAPGKVILFGEHAVVYGKKAIATCLSEIRTRVRAVIRPTPCASGQEGLLITAPAIQINSPLSIPFCDLPAEEKHGSELFDSLYKFAGGLQIGSAPLGQLEKGGEEEVEKGGEEEEVERARVFMALACCLFHVVELGVPLAQSMKHSVLELHITSDLPISSGMGSSASFNVCLAATMLTVCGRIVPNADKMLSHEELLLVNQWAFMGEQFMHGTPSGIDNSVSTFGHAVVLHKQHNKTILEPVYSIPKDLRILMVNTCVPRDTKRLVALFREKLHSPNNNPQHVEQVLQQFQDITDQCLKLFEQYHEKKVPLDEQFYDLFQNLMDTNHKLLNELGVGHPSLETVVKLAAKYQLHAKLTGAGGGGCAYVLIKQTTSDETMNQLLADLAQHKFLCYPSNIGGIGVKFEKLD